MRYEKFAAAFAFGAVMITTPAISQIASTPDVVTTIRELGANWNPDVLAATREAYRPLLEAAPKDGVEVVRDIAYGEHERQVLDLHKPATAAGEAVPVVMFVHGGGFTSGNRSDADQMLYDNVLTWFARKGLLGVNFTYRLAPDHPWPAGPQDIASALAWLRANAADHGGDPERIYIVGQSAGATHVASYIFHEEFQPEGGADGVAGAVLVSGVYRPSPDSERHRAYYGADDTKYDEMASVNNVDGRKIPVFVVYAEFDPYQMQIESLRLAEALCERDSQCPRLLHMVGHNHLSPMAAMNTADEQLGLEILDFIEKGR